MKKFIYRSAEAEIARANEIINAEMPNGLKANLLPIKSPGRASLINTLYENFGYRGARLDPRVYESYWLVLAEGSSFFAHPALKIAGDELSTIVQVVTHSFERHDEIPGGVEELSERCVVIKKKSETIEYYGISVELEPQQFKFVCYLLKCAFREDRDVPDIEVYDELGATPNLVEVMSRIRSAFKDATATLDDERQKLAVLLVKQLFPEKGKVGYRIGLPDLFVTVD